MILKVGFTPMETTLIIIGAGSERQIVKFAEFYMLNITCSLTKKMVAIKKVTFREKFDDLDDAKKWVLAQDKNLSYKFHFTCFHLYFEGQLIMC